MEEKVMTQEKIYAKLNEIFRDIFMDDSIELTPDTTASDIEDWDSLMHVTLIAEVEKIFEIKFAAKESKEIKNVGQMAEAIERLQK